MRQILVRAGYVPTDVPSLDEIMCKDLLGGNSGNLIYANSIYRTLTTDTDTRFIADQYRLKYRNLDWINENCERYIIPMADTFREGQENYINHLAGYIRKLRIPCTIVGIGIRADVPEEIYESHVYDEAARNLMDAVLDKSAMVGVRGESTARYLSHLGYREEEHFTVIGCPSMYINGGKIQRKDLKLSDSMKLSINMSNRASDNTVDFLRGLMDKHSDSYYVPQRIEELQTLYLGKLYQPVYQPVHFPYDTSDPLYTEDRVKYFISAQAWLDYLKGRDLVIGSRLHGNIAAIQAGTPSVLIPHDMRMKELVAYHHLPHVKPEDVLPSTPLEEIIAKVDFDGVKKYHGRNFRHYCDFLEKNEIPHIFEEKNTVEDAAHDALMRQVEIPESIPSCVTLSREAIADRWQNYYNAQTANRNQVISERVEDMNGLKETIKKQKTSIRELEQLVKDQKKMIRMLDETSLSMDARSMGKKLLEKVTGHRTSNYDRLSAIRNKK